MDYINLYRNYIILEKGLSDLTLEAYLHDVEKLLSFFSDEGIDPLKACLDDFHRFAATLIDAAIAPRSIARILSGVRSFYHFLVLEEYIDQDPTLFLESPKIGKHLPEVLSLSEIDALESVIDLSTEEGIRNRVILEVLYSCGLRVSELCSLLISDIFSDEGFIRIWGKGSKQIGRAHV